METQDDKKFNQSGHEGHHGVHICHKCGWPFPNPHPSAKHRRAHKRICGTIEGYKLDSSDENETHLMNVSCDDERLLDEEAEVPGEKGSKAKIENTIIKISGGGVGSRSSRSTRSEDEVFSDAILDFADGSGVDCSDGTREQAIAMKKVAEDHSGYTLLPGEIAVADAGNLYLQNSTNASQLQASQYPRTEHERVENDKQSEETPHSSTIDSVCSDFSAGGDERRAGQNVFPSSEISTAFDLDNGKGSKEEVADKMSAELATIATESSGKKVNAVPSAGDSLNSASADPLLKGTGKQEIGLGTGHNRSPKVDFIRETTDAFVNSSLAKNDANEMAGSSTGMSEEGLGSSTNRVRVLDVADDFPLREQPEIMPEDFKNHKAGKLTISPSQGSSDEVKFSEHNEDFASKEIQSTASVDEPEYSEKLKSEDAIFETDDSREGGTRLVVVDVKSTEEVAVEGTQGKTKNDATDAGICGSTSVKVHQDLDCKNNGQGQTLESSEEQKSLVTCHHSLQNDSSVIQSVKGVEVVHDQENDDNKDSRICDVLENEGVVRDREKSLAIGEAYSGFAIHVTSEVGQTTNSTGGSDQGDFNTKISVERVKSSDAELGLQDKVEARKNYKHDHVAANLESTSDGHGSEMVGSSFQSKNLQELQEGVKDMKSSIDQTVVEESNGSAGVHAASSLENSLDETQEVKNVDRCLRRKVSNSAAANQFSSVNESSGVTESNAPLDSTEASPEGAKVTKKPDESAFGREGIGKVDLGLISDHDDGTDSTKKTAKEVAMRMQGNSASVQASTAFENEVTQEMGKEASSIVNVPVQVQGDVNHVKHDEVVSVLDYQADSSSQSDSLEGNWGSVSVLSASSEAAPATDMGSLPSQASVEAEKANVQPKAEARAGSAASDVFESKNVDHREWNDQKEGANKVEALQRPQEQVKESPGIKKNKEIIAKVTNWSTGKQHIPLKSLLREPDQMDDIPPTGSTDFSAKTEKVILDTQKAPMGEVAKGAVGKEWNSPARYPANIKRVKRKVRSRPYWAPFICCSSMERG